MAGLSLDGLAKNHMLFDTKVYISTSYIVLLQTIALATTLHSSFERKLAPL